MKLVVLQPSYLPWLGYFDQYHWADTFVLYDDVQYDKHGWRNRNRILTRNGVQWLTVPVITRGKGTPTIDQVAIDNRTDWRRKHRMSLRQAYSKAPCFAAVSPALDDLLSRPWERLIDLDIAALRVLVDLLGMRWKVIRSSEMPGVTGRKNQRLLAICRALGATEYKSGDAARTYLDEAAFAAAGVAVHWHGYRHPTYHQPSERFQSHLSVVDLLFNHGPDSLAILTGALQPAPRSPHSRLA